MEQTIQQKKFYGYTIESLFDRMAKDVEPTSEEEKNWRIAMEKENNKLNGGLN